MMPTKPTHAGTTPQLDYAIANPLEAVVWQDALLQSYRSFQLVLQSIFTAAGVGLTVAVIGFDSPLSKRLSATVLAVVGGIALFIMFKLRTAIRARGEDVWYWQSEVIRAEDCCHERYFSKFKVDQILRRGANKTIQEVLTLDKLTDDEVHQLIGRSDPRMRRLLERTIVWSLVALWAVLFSVAALALLA